MMMRRFLVPLAIAVAATSIPAFAHDRPDAAATRQASTHQTERATAPRAVEPRVIEPRAVAPRVERPMVVPRIERAAPAPRIERVAPAPRIERAAPAPRIERVAPAPRVERVAPAPRIERVVPAPRIERVVPQPRIEREPFMVPRTRVITRTIVEPIEAPRTVVQVRERERIMEREVFPGRAVSTVLVPVTTTTTPSIFVVNPQPQFVQAYVMQPQFVSVPLATQPVVELNTGFLAAPLMQPVVFNPYVNQESVNGDCDDDDSLCGQPVAVTNGYTQLYPTYAGFGSPFGNAQLQGVVVANTGTSLVVMTPSLRPIFVDAAPAEQLGYANTSLQPGTLVDAFGYYNGNTFIATTIE